MMIDCFRFWATTTKMTTKTTTTAAAIVVMIMVTMTMSRKTAFDKKNAQYGSSIVWFTVNFFMLPQ